MRRTFSPQLTDIVLEVPQSIRDVEVYPLPIPDLYAGYPVTVAGKYSGNFPTTLTVRGLILLLSHSPFPSPSLF
jgi:hypothetical protein